MGLEHKWRDEPSAYLLCAICSNVFDRPSAACGEGHDFCKQCLLDWIKHAREGQATCPTCRGALLDIRPNRGLQSQIDGLLLHCPNAAVSQGHIGSSSSSSSSSRNDREDECHWIGPLNDLSRHLSECPARMVDCDRCKMIGFRVSALHNHHERECMDSPAACKYQHLGCQETPNRRDLPAHYKKAGDQHLPLISRDFEEKLRLLEGNFNASEAAVKRDFEAKLRLQEGNIKRDLEAKLSLLQQELSLLQQELRLLYVEKVQPYEEFLKEKMALQTLQRLLHSADPSSPPIEPSKLSSVQSLSLNGKNIQQLPPEISLLTALVKIELSHNPLQQLPPQISLLTNVQSLEINYNQLPLLPHGLSALTSLRVLGLHNNQLQEVPPGLSALTSLQFFALYNNPLQRLPPQFSALTSLKGLYLSAIQLQNLPAEMSAFRARVEVRDR